jgi:hypothetical protein
MISQDLCGAWCLVGTVSTRSQIALINGQPDPRGIEQWLKGVDDRLIETATETSGLLLSISPEASFTEQLTGKPTVYWFDEEGVLAGEVSPFNGVVVQTQQGAYLKPAEIAKFGRPVEGRYGNVVLRYDDGDTKIADGLRRVGAQLIRTVNVVTDELYLDRVVVVYRPYIQQLPGQH